MSGFAGLFLSLLLIYKYAIVGVAYFLDSFAIPIPGNTIIFSGGAFASQGYLSFWYIFLAALAGNMFGDVLCYRLAARYGRRVIGVLRINDRYLNAIESAVRAYPRGMIFVTRFGGPLDPIGNVVAGMFKLRFNDFLLYGIAGNAIALLMLESAGFVLGSYWQAFLSVLQTATWVIVLAVIAGVLLVVFRKHLGLSHTRTGRAISQRIARIRKFLQQEVHIDIP